MKTIWRFPLGLSPTQTILMPEDARILCVQTQNEWPCIWVKVDTEATKKPRTIITHGTGHPILHEPGKYIGTYQLENGSLIFHVFEK